MHFLGSEPTPYGRLAQVALPDPLALPPSDLCAALDPLEAAEAARLLPRRRSTFVAGRIALREALRTFGCTPGPILWTPRGAPAMPRGFVGSVSHKDDLVVALVDQDRGEGIGVDVESLLPPRVRIRDRVLTERENAPLDTLPEAQAWPEVLLRFSIKEAIYKALDRFLGRYVNFKEAEIARLPALSELAAGFTEVQVTLSLARGEGPFVVEAAVRVHSSVVSIVRIRRGDGPKLQET